MHARRLPVLATLLLALTLDPAEAARRLPALTAATPSCAAPGDTVRLTGTRLRGVRKMLVAGSPIRVRKAGKDRLALVLPAGVPDGPLPLALKRGRRVLRFDGLLRVGCSRDLSLETADALAETASVGSAGGAFAATAADGTTLGLDFPARALPSGRAITITPVTGIAGLPFPGGLVAAARFTPDGLAFATPARFTITLARHPGAGPLVGFAFDGDGRDWRLVPVVRDGAQLTIAVPHFSGAGAAAPDEADFVAVVRPILDSIAAPAPGSPTLIQNVLSVQLMVSLRDIMAVWDGIFPGFCERDPGGPLCDEIEAKISLSIQLRLGLLCPAQPGDPVPAVDELALDQVLDLAAVAAAGGNDTVEAFACAEAILVALVEEAGATAFATPRLGSLQRLIDLSARAIFLGFQDAGDLAIAKLDAAVGHLLDEANALCPAAFEVGVDAALLARRFVPALDSRHPGLDEEIDAVLERCGVAVQVNPTQVELTPGTTVHFTAIVVHADDQTVAWNTTGSRNQIAADGTFTAGSQRGTFRVTAQSAVLPTAIAEVTVRIVDEAPPPPEPLTMRSSCVRTNRVNFGPLTVASASAAAEGGVRPFEVTVSASPGVFVGRGDDGGIGDVQIETPGDSFTVTVTVRSLANGETASKSMTITKGPNGFAFGGCDSVRDVQQFFSDA